MKRPRKPTRTPSFVGLSPSSKAASASKSRVRKTGTKPEVVLQNRLRRLGLRFRVDVGTLPGRPDVVFPLAKVAVFCDGDFWHGRDWPSRRRRLLKGSNPDYWIAKIKANRRRDRHQVKLLEADGWHVIRLWEGDIHADPDRLAEDIRRVVVHLGRAKSAVHADLELVVHA